MAQHPHPRGVAREPGSGIPLYRCTADGALIGHLVDRADNSARAFTGRRHQHGDRPRRRRPGQLVLRRDRAGCRAGNAAQPHGFPHRRQRHRAQREIPNLELLDRSRVAGITFVPLDTPLARSSRLPSRSTPRARELRVAIRELFRCRGRRAALRHARLRTPVDLGSPTASLRVKHIDFERRRIRVAENAVVVQV